MAFQLNISSNFDQLVGKLRERIEVLKNPEYLFRPVCFDLIDLMTQRIHVDGIAADGTPIGQYSSTYLKLREKKYNRSTDKKVIISLTRQLENDWSVTATQNGYGIGFKNSHNYDKAGWVEETYDKPIFSLSSSEEQFAFEGITIQIQNALRGGK